MKLSLLISILILGNIHIIIGEECEGEHLQCDSGKCMPLSWKCDGDDDCGDGTDERNCAPASCKTNEFQCEISKTCIPARWKCDEEPDCPNGEDERDDVCSARTCPPGQFNCGENGQGGMCIPEEWQCDKQSDCPDGQDEKHCHQPTCQSDEFQCNSTEKLQCISKNWHCDGDADCDDKSDETNCPEATCEEGHSKCTSDGRCIPDRWRCDGDPDCVDGSDENNCQDRVRSLCPENEFSCGNGECIHHSWACDGEEDCTNGKDEQCNETVTCRPDQFACQEGSQIICIQGTLQCDGKNDCKQGEDEHDCPTPPASCDPKTQFDCSMGNGEFCIDIDKVCDHKDDCGMGEDELNCKVKKQDQCKTNNGGCSHNCSSNVNGITCSCPPGFTLENNKKICRDINECLKPGTCSQICENVKGGFKCSCREGYSVEPSNPHKCRANGNEPYLLFSNRRDLREIRLESRHYRTVVGQTRSAIALDYDYDAQMVFWTDIAEEKIYSSVLNGNEGTKKVVAEGASTADGIAVDWIHKKVYWTDTGKKSIEVAHFDGSMRKTLFNFTNDDEPRALVLDPHNGYMYWTDWGSNPRIEKAGMDGSHRKTLITSDIVWPNGLAIDYVDSRIYWVDAKLNQIGSSNLDGKERRIVLHSMEHLKHPFAITVFEDYVYWSEWEKEAIHIASKFNGSQVRTVAVGLYSPMDVHIYHKLRQPTGNSSCGKNNGGCAHLCLASPQFTKQSAKYTCACKDGYELDVKSTAHDSVARECVKSAFPTGSENDINITISTSKSQKNTTRSGSKNASHMLRRTPKPTVLSTGINRPPIIPDKPVTASNKTQGPTVRYGITGSNGIVAKTNGDGKGSTQPQGTEIGKLAGMVVGIVAFIIIIIAIVGFIIYRRQSQRNAKGLNFDNPVYRKTTEDQFCIEKNQMQPKTTKTPLPPSLEPLNRPANEYC